MRRVVVDLVKFVVKTLFDLFNSGTSVESRQAIGLADILNVAVHAGHHEDACAPRWARVTE